MAHGEVVAHIHMLIHRYQQKEENEERESEGKENSVFPGDLVVRITKEQCFGEGKDR